jgi:hypothetical protein
MPRIGHADLTQFSIQMAFRASAIRQLQCPVLVVRLRALTRLKVVP